jgi:hypothetical protein
LIRNSHGTPKERHDYPINPALLLIYTAFFVDLDGHRYDCSETLVEFDEAKEDGLSSLKQVLLSLVHFIGR